MSIRRKFIKSLECDVDDRQQAIRPNRPSALTNGTLEGIIVCLKSRVRLCREEK